jgi:pimeloyl-ACP methyl ester carboxylesterase/DNA-binding NarL/FixJ family response regulator
MGSEPCFDIRHAGNPRAEHLMREVDLKQKSEIIDHLYDVALDPARYEALLDVWEARMAPLRAESDLDADADFHGMEDADLEAHAARAGIFLDRLKEDDGMDEQSVLDFEVAAAFLVTQDFNIAAVNRAASEILAIAQGDPISKLDIQDEDKAELRNAIAIATNKGIAKPSLLRFISPRSDRPMVFHVTQLSGPSFKRTFALVRTTELGWPDNLSVTIRDAFQLTSAEIDIVRSLAEGRSVKAIAIERGRSFETVRSQIRSILAKTETRSQSELIRITLGLMEVVSSTNSADSQKPYASDALKPIPFQSMKMPDGRRYDWIEFGDRQGRPLLFLPLDYGMIRWPLSAQTAAEKLAIRVISPVRAGFGHSSELPPKVDYAGETGEDMNRLLVHLGIKQCAVMAMGADLRYAMRLAIAHPEKVKGIFACSGALPAMTAAHYERMGKFHRFILANARYAPMILPFLVKAGFSLAKRIGRESFFRSVNEGSPADLRTFDVPEVREAILMGSEICLSDWHTAHAAFSRECIDSETNWAATVRACKVPVRMLQGGEDPQSPKETILELAKEFPHLDIEIIDEAGQLLFFQEWPRVLKELERFLPES